MIEIDVTTDQLRAALGRALATYGDLSPLMDEIGDGMIERTQSNLAAGTSPDGTAFAPRSAVTERAYELADPPKVPVGGPLVLTGDMMNNSIHAEAGADFVTWGSSAPQSAVMQFGAEQGAFGARMGQDKNGRAFFVTLPWGDIPARPFLGIGPEDETAVTEVIEGWMEEAFTG
jgi:phage gpG-like protein